MSNLKSALNLIGDKIFDVIEKEEKKHGKGILFIGVNNSKLKVVHVPVNRFDDDKFMQERLKECTENGTIVIFTSKDEKQEYGCLEKKSCDKIKRDGSKAIENKVEKKSVDTESETICKKK